MAWHERSFSQRFAVMGDEAEAVYQHLFPHSQEVGLKRPSINLADMDPLLRNLPDFVEAKAFVECQGMGRAGNVKIKVEKLQAQLQWQIVAPVDFFVWDSHRRRWWRAPLIDWYKACLAHGEYGVYHDGPGYMALKAKDFPVDPTKYDGPDPDVLLGRCA